ncbi:MAG: exonuclease SbcCD subunit D C-terminal domain-containing protein [Flavobacteriaceae bacterium]|nr:exonuclease SbcCD subunit D C-terminal domain-containing protein [Flavobacteriaceae bacterium]
MKILHTSDWHLGHRLHDQVQTQEQQLFLEWLLSTVISNQIDVLLIAGDIFDTGTPSTLSLKMYYDFLVALRTTACSHIIVTGGNHDSPGTMNAPKELLETLSVKVIGKATEDLAEEVFKLSVNEESIIVAAVPYLRDQDIRKAVAGEQFDDITERYKQALIHHYSEVGIIADSLNADGCPMIAMGHLFAIGGSVSDSEQNIYVGNLGHIGAEDFPSCFDYIALGHLHRPQIVGGNPKVRYSGSPVILSFSEVNQRKNIVILETDQSIISDVVALEIPVFRKVVRIKGTIDECEDELKKLTTNSYGLKPWVEVVLNDTSPTTLGAVAINNIVASLEIEVLKVTLKNQRKVMGLEELTAEIRNVKELSPLRVFEMKCEEMDFDLKANDSVLDAFNEALQIALDN